MTYSPVAIDVWVKQRRDESSLWRERGIVVFHIQIEDESAIRIGALWGLCHVRILKRGIKSVGDTNPLHNDLPESHVRFGNINIVTRMWVCHDVFHLSNYS